MHHSAWGDSETSRIGAFIGGPHFESDRLAQSEVLEVRFLGISRATTDGAYPKLALSILGFDFLQFWVVADDNSELAGPLEVVRSSGLHLLTED